MHFCISDCERSAKSIDVLQQTSPISVAFTCKIRLVKLKYKIPLVSFFLGHGVVLIAFSECNAGACEKLMLTGSNISHLLWSSLLQFAIAYAWRQQRAAEPNVSTRLCDASDVQFAEKIKTSCTQSRLPVAQNGEIVFLTV